MINLSSPALRVWFLVSLELVLATLGRAGAHRSPNDPWSAALGWGTLRPDPAHPRSRPSRSPAPPRAAPPPRPPARGPRPWWCSRASPRSCPRSCSSPWRGWGTEMRSVSAGSGPPGEPAPRAAGGQGAGPGRGRAGPVPSPARRPGRAPPGTPRRSPRSSPVRSRPSGPHRRRPGWSGTCASVALPGTAAARPEPAQPSATPQVLGRAGSGPSRSQTRAGRGESSGVGPAAPGLCPPRGARNVSRPSADVWTCGPSSSCRRELPQQLHL